MLQMLQQMQGSGSGGLNFGGPPSAQVLASLHCGTCVHSPVPGTDGKSFRVTPVKGRGTLTLGAHWGGEGGGPPGRRLI